MKPLKWSGDGAIPALGATVNVRINNIGPCKVLSYFSDEGYIGLMVAPIDPPEWLLSRMKQASTFKFDVFGIEIGDGPEIKSVVIKI